LAISFIESSLAVFAGVAASSLFRTGLSSFSIISAAFLLFFVVDEAGSGFCIFAFKGGSTEVLEDSATSDLSLVVDFFFSFGGSATLGVSARVDPFAFLFFFFADSAVGCGSSTTSSAFFFSGLPLDSAEVASFSFFLFLGIGAGSSEDGAAIQTYY